MKNKFIVVGLASTLLVSQSIPFKNAVVNAEETQKQNDFRFSGVKKVVDNQIFLNSGIVVTKKNDKVTTATDEKGKLEFVATKKSDNLIELKNVQTGKIENVKINSETYVESSEEQQATDDAISGTNFVNYSSSPPKGSVDGYKYVRTKKTNTYIKSAEEGAVVAIITSVCGPLGTAAGVAYAIASVYVAANSKIMYWKERTYTKWLNKWSMSVKTQYNYYKDRDYKKYIKTITKYRTYQSGGV